MGLRCFICQLYLHEVPPEAMRQVQAPATSEIYVMIALVGLWGRHNRAGACEWRTSSYARLFGCLGVQCYLGARKQSLQFMRCAVLARYLLAPGF